jgi:hypothetical protein
MARLKQMEAAKLNGATPKRQIPATPSNTDNSRTDFSLRGLQAPLQADGTELASAPSIRSRNSEAL